MGYLTNKMPKERKQKIVLIFDIIVIIVFIFWALNERATYLAGVNDCSRAWCEWLPKNTNKFCPENYSMFGTGNISVGIP